ncbi:MAG: HNH endonuclease [Verrucomicrobiaceae bacterium]|nr:HNH endonuclease [Verrucomicrobiaceae bacterium]
MSEILNRAIVLVLNRHWQAIDVKTPVETFSMLVNGSATALDITLGEEMRPVTWDEWLTLPVRETDFAIGTVRGGIRVPTVVVLARFDKVPKRRPKFCARAIWERDGGVCQYTGRKLRPSEGNIDHIVPRSRGGKTSWENCVLADKRVNSKKGNKLPEEVGLRLLRQPFVPKEIPTSALIRNHFSVREWDLFIGEPAHRQVAMV